MQGSRELLLLNLGRKSKERKRYAMLESWDKVGGSVEVELRSRGAGSKWTSDDGEDMGDAGPRDDRQRECLR